MPVVLVDPALADRGVEQQAAHLALVDGLLDGELGKAAEATAQVGRRDLLSRAAGDHQRLAEHVLLGVALTGLLHRRERVPRDVGGRARREHGGGRLVVEEVQAAVGHRGGCLGDLLGLVEVADRLGLHPVEHLLLAAHGDVLTRLRLLLRLHGARGLVEELRHNRLVLRKVQLGLGALPLHPAANSTHPLHLGEHELGCEGVRVVGVLRGVLHPLAVLDADVLLPLVSRLERRDQDALVAEIGDRVVRVVVQDRPHQRVVLERGDERGADEDGERLAQREVGPQPLDRGHLGRRRRVGVELLLGEGVGLVVDRDDGAARGDLVLRPRDEGVDVLRLLVRVEKEVGRVEVADGRGRVGVAPERRPKRARDDGDARLGPPRLLHLLHELGEGPDLVGRDADSDHGPRDLQGDADDGDHGHRLALARRRSYVERRHGDGAGGAHDPGVGNARGRVRDLPVGVCLPQGLRRRGVGVGGGLGPPPERLLPLRAGGVGDDVVEAHVSILAGGPRGRLVLALVGVERRLAPAGQLVGPSQLHGRGGGHKVVHALRDGQRLATGLRGVAHVVDASRQRTDGVGALEGGEDEPASLLVA